MFLQLNSHLANLYRNIKALEELAARHVFQSLNSVRVKKKPHHGQVGENVLQWVGTVGLLKGRCKWAVTL